MYCSQELNTWLYDTAISVAGTGGSLLLSRSVAATCTVFCQGTNKYGAHDSTEGSVLTIDEG